MSEETRPVATPSQTVGPFFHFALGVNDALGRMADGSTAGERIRLRVRVLDGDGLPVPDALIELYHAAADGTYPSPAQRGAFTGFGRLPTLEDGTCVFDTIHPGPVTSPGGRRQASHVNVCLLARGLLRHVYTRIYFEGDPVQDDDPVLALVPGGRRHTLMARRMDTGTSSSGTEPPTWEFVLRMQGQDETVFFDL